MRLRRFLRSVGLLLGLALLLPSLTRQAAAVESSAPLVGWAGGSEHPEVRRDITGTWMSRESWTNLEKGEWLNDPKNGARQWLDAGHYDKAMVINAPLIPHNMPPGEHNASGRAQRWNALLDETVSGARDEVYRSLGSSLARFGSQTVYCALWWEMNQYHADTDVARFKQAWARAVPLIREGFASAAKPGQQILIGYNPMASGKDRWVRLPDSLDLVDWVGMNIYAGVWTDTVPSEAQVLDYTGSRLAELAAKGRELGLPVGIPEWGNWATHEGHPGTFTRGRGDCPAFIDQVADWAAEPANNVVFIVHFDINHGPNNNALDLNDTPESLRRMAERFPRSAE